MSNIFHGGGLDLDLTNGGTSVFVEVLMLAVSDLAERPWELRFAALLALQDQQVRGRGLVGFDLADVDWGPTPAGQQAAKSFALAVVDLAQRRHRWDELGYEPPRAPAYLRRFRTMVAAADSGRPPRDTAGFPAPHEALVASCARHRVLSALPHWDGCVFCTDPR